MRYKSKLSGNKFSTIANISFPSRKNYWLTIFAYSPTHCKFLRLFSHLYCSKGRNTFCDNKFSSLLCTTTKRHYRLNLTEMKRFLHSLGLEKIPSDSIIIGDDLALINFNNNKPTYATHEPYKLKHAVICICTAGHCSIKVNLQQYEIESPMLVTLMPGQIVEGMNYSPNFDGINIVLSKRFIDMLNLPGWQQQYMKLYNNPLNEISTEALRHLQIFYTILHKAASDEENPFRLQVIENLIRVFYYGGISKFRNIERSNTTPKNSIVERFMELVQEHYREERLIGFYADKLCITPKYLNEICRKKTKHTAKEVITRSVIAQIKSALIVSGTSVQRIAYDFNFCDQSSFGKYFKKAVGMAPMAYRNKHNGDTAFTDED